MLHPACAHPLHARPDLDPAIHPVARIVAPLLVIQALLLLAHAWGSTLPAGHAWRYLFWLGGEGRLPAVFQTGQFLVLAALASSLARRERRPVWSWCRGAALFAAADELLGLHERVGDLVQAAGVTPAWGAALHPWVHVMVPAVLLFGLALGRPLVRALGWRGVAGLACALAIFLGGAVGVESWQTVLRQRLEAAGLPWTPVARQPWLMLEEGLEMLGATLAVGVFAWRRVAPRAKPERVARRVVR